MLGNMLYWLLRGPMWVFTYIVCRYHVQGRTNMPAVGPLLIVSNHLSWFDPFLLGVVMPRRLWFYTKIEVFRWPVAGWLCKQTGQIPVHRGRGDRSSLVQALAYLREGKAVVVFPEGTVERQERMISAHSGIAMLAVRSGVPLLPVAHSGTRNILRAGRGWFPRVDIEIGKPFIPQVPAGVSHREALQVMTRDIMQRIAVMLPAEQRGFYE